MNNGRQDRPHTSEPEPRDLTRTPDAPPRKRRPPRPVTRARLMNQALHYLERFSSSRANLKRVLERRTIKAMRVHGGDPEAVAGWIEDVLQTLERQGFLNDAAYAEATARSLAARGQSVRAIRARLAAKGVARDHVNAALARVADEMAPEREGGDPDLAAAVTYARRRRLGPWRPPEARAERREKDMATLARRGFSLDVARAVIDADTPEDLEEGLE